MPNETSPTNTVHDMYAAFAAVEIDPGLGLGLPPIAVRDSFTAGCDAILRLLAERAEREFPAVIPALKQLAAETSEVAVCEMGTSEIMAVARVNDDKPAPRRPVWWEAVRHG